LKVCIPRLNDYLTFQDEDLSFKLIETVDAFKLIDVPKETNQKVLFEELIETAFQIDESTTFNLSTNLNQAKKKAL